MKRWFLDRGGLLALLALGVYAFVAAPHIVGNDSAELSTLGTTGGVAHPSGYPGYVLWLRAWSWLPGTAAFSASIATAVLGALSILALHAACRGWGAKPAAATIACAVYAAAPIIVRYSSEADVFAPNQLAVALVLWLAAPNGPLRGDRRALALGVVAGLGMTNNLTCTLVAPVGLVGVWLAMREQKRWWSAIALACLGWLVGMVPYVYVAIAPQNTLSWPNPTSFDALLDLILRRSYGSLDLVGTGQPVPIGAQLQVLASTITRTWLWVLPVLGLATLLVRCVRPGRVPWIALALSTALAGPLLVMRFDVQPVDIGLQLVHRFHLLPALLLAIPIASGLQWIADELGKRSQTPPRASLAMFAAYVAFAAATFVAVLDVSRFHTPAMENAARNTLRSLPPRAVVMSNVADDLDVATRYLQLTEDERTDVLYFRYPDLVVPWYAAKVGVAPASAVALVERFHTEGRPVFVNWWEKDLRAKYPSYPFGILVRLLPVGAPVPALEEQFATNRSLFETFDLAYPLPGKADDFATWVHRKYAGTWGRLSSDLAAAGNRELAATAFEIGRALQPQQ